MQETFGRLPNAAMDLALQLLDIFPVLLLTYGKQAILVNTPEVIISGGFRGGGGKEVIFAYITARVDQMIVQK